LRQTVGQLLARETVMRKRIGLRAVEGLKLGEKIWDTVVPGLHARRRGTGAITYVLHYRTAEGRQRWFTIGQHGAPWTPDSAREEAKRLLGTVVIGDDPVAVKRSKRQALTISALCDLYVKEVEAGRILTRDGQSKKASTLATDKGRIRWHIKPVLGHYRVGAVTSADVDAFMHDVAAGKTAVQKAKKRGGIARGGKGTATRTLGLLGGIFTYAVRHGMRPDNPTKGIIRFADGQRQRRLSDREYTAFGEAIRGAREEGIWPPAIALTEFLLLTGWRMGEARGLRWHDVDLASRTAMLGDTKTGKSMRPLSVHACVVLRGLTKAAGNSLVFPGTRGNGPMTGYRSIWNRIIKFGGLPKDVTPHTGRHSLCSLANDLGYTEATIGMIVGHKKGGMTRRYIHKADPVLLAACDAITTRIVELMAGGVEQAVA
jgi:integrase